MKALVTGGAGFLGSFLVDRLLAKGYEVTALDDVSSGDELKIFHNFKNPGFHFVRDSILNRNIMDDLIAKCDIVYHFGAVVGVHHYVINPYAVLNVNINGTFIVLQLAHKYNKKVCFASTSEVYGRNTDVPFKEDHDRVLGSTKIDRWCYSTSKAAGEHFCFAFSKMGLPVVIYRFFNIYGPRMDKLDTGRVITIFMGKVLRHEPVTVVGDGSQIRCFTYVDDATEGIILGSEKKEAEGEVFNIGANAETSILELAKMMIKISGSKSKIEYVAQEQVYGKSYEDIQRRVPDVSKAKRVLGFQAKTPLDVGLEKTIAWFKENNL